MQTATAPDPALAAAYALELANEAFDHVITARDRQASDAALYEVNHRAGVFADARPDTPAGIRCKINEARRLLAIVETGECELTPDGAALIRRHLEAILEGVTRPRLAP